MVCITIDNRQACLESNTQGEQSHIGEETSYGSLLLIASQCYQTSRSRQSCHARQGLVR